MFFLEIAFDQGAVGLGGAQIGADVADWLLLQEIKAGRAPYRVHDAEVLPGDHVLMFERMP